MEKERKASFGECPYCGRKISKSNMDRHIKTHGNGSFDRQNKKYRLDHDDLFCKFCGKECKNQKSLLQHEMRCRENPNRIKSTGIVGFNDVGREAWNKGLTKESDERVRKYGEKISKALSGREGKPHSEESKAKLRDVALRRNLGGFHMRRGILYNGVKLDSSYEVVLAKDLDKNCIVWERPPRFSYRMDGKLHYYTPDFYLPDYDIYLDPKNDFLINNVNPRLGYKDVDKIKAVEVENNIRVLILAHDQLSWSIIKEMLP